MNQRRFRAARQNPQREPGEEEGAVARQGRTPWCSGDWQWSGPVGYSSPPRVAAATFLELFAASVAEENYNENEPAPPSKSAT